MSSPPRNLSELRVAVQAGAPHMAGIAGACEAIEIGDDGWRDELRSRPPHLALIESSGLRDRPVDTADLDPVRVARAEELVEWCRREDVPAVLWETSLRRRIATPAELVGGVGPVFVADGQLASEPTEQLAGRSPRILPLAAQTVPEESLGYRERVHEIAFLARWTNGFAGRLRDELLEILEAAEGSGLVAFRLQRDIDRGDGFPERFAGSVVPISNPRDAVGAFRNSRIVIALDAKNQGRLMVPQVAFDAIAAGAVPLIPSQPASRRLLRYVALVATDRVEAAEGIARLLGDEEQWSGASAAARSAALHAHTYSNRIATIASSIGFRLVPEIEPKRATASV